MQSYDLVTSVREKVFGNSCSRTGQTIWILPLFKGAEAEGPGVFMEIKIDFLVVSNRRG